MRTNDGERARHGQTGRQRTRRAGGLSLRWSSVLCCLALAGCGDTVRPLGVLVNDAGVTKELVEAAVGPPPPMEVDSRVRGGNLMGDAAVDRVAVLPRGRGLEIHDGTSPNAIRLPTAFFVTDFAVIRETGSPVDDLVVLEYPNDTRGGTLSVFSFPDMARQATWEESPSPGWVGIGSWQDEPGIFYLMPDAIVVRATDGRVLMRLAAPGLSAFRSVHPAALGGDRTAVLASGDGYTPYHMVAIFNAQGKLVFHEQADEHAWRLTVGSDGNTFDVDTRSKRWRYKTR